MRFSSGGGRFWIIWRGRTLNLIGRLSSLWGWLGDPDRLLLLRKFDNDFIVWTETYFLGNIPLGQIISFWVGLYMNLIS